MRKPCHIILAATAALALAFSCSTKEEKDTPDGKEAAVLQIRATMPSAEVASAVKSLEINPFEADQTGLSLEVPHDAVKGSVITLSATLPDEGTAFPEGSSILATFNAPDTEHTVYTHFATLPDGISPDRDCTLELDCRNTDRYAGASDKGTSTAPYLIADRYQMEAVHGLMASGSATHFRLLADIDMEGAGWIPLNSESPFDRSVCFDGNGHTLSGFTVSVTDIPAGLFSVLDGQVRNLSLENASISTAARYSAVLAGRADGNASVSGCTVKGCTVSGKDIVGGLLGRLGGSGSSCTYCFVKNSSVNASYRRAGGLVGNLSAAAVSRCGVESDVSVTSTSYDVAGLVGLTEDAFSIDNSYSMAGATGTDNVGGLVGRLLGTGKVSNCFASGAVSASTPNAGGLVGSIEAAGSILKCISWNSGMGLYGANSGNGTVSGCYVKDASESGTVSSHAQEAAMGWSADVWDFSTPFPTLRAGGDTPVVTPPDGYDCLLIPYPNSLTPGSGSFSVYGATVHYDTSLEAIGAVDIADAVASRLGTSKAATSSAGEAVGINFLTDSSLGREAYSMQITGERIVIRASAREGFFYAVQTLRQLLPAAVYGTAAPTAQWTVPCLSIVDEPRFAWRGMHLDVSRHFFTVDEIKRYLDIMALYKLNRFHWHLTDDQGWRIEIDGDEALTRYGAYRGDSHPAYPGYDRENGFYTREQVAEIVRYAHERCITVVPELDLPGHAASLLAAHRELGCEDKEYRVWTGYGINTDLLCIAKATGAQKDILDNIVKQVASMFPDSEFIHFGGDETRTGASYTNSWKKCPDCLALMESLGLSDAASSTREARLQYHFTKYLHGLAAKYGKNIIGWQEIYISDPADFDVADLPGACIESWTQAGHGINAAKAGLRGIVAPSYSHYLSYPQSGSDRNVTLNDCYTKTLNDSNAFGCTDEQLARLLGTEGCMWTESIESFGELEYLLLPRLCAVSEVAWTKFENKDYERLKDSIRNCHFAIYETLHLNYNNRID